MAVFTLVLILIAALLIIPLGFPGIWVMVAVAVAYSFIVPNSIGWIALTGTALVALVAEVMEFMLGGRYARKYGGSSRASWGAVVGGLAGAFIGVPVPVLGPVIGGFAGAFVGALVAEFSRGSGAEVSARAAVGAVVGRAMGAALKIAMGLVVAAWLVVSAVS